MCAGSHPRRSLIRRRHSFLLKERGGDAGMDPRDALCGPVSPRKGRANTLPGVVPHSSCRNRFYYRLAHERPPCGSHDKDFRRSIADSRSRNYPHYLAPYSDSSRYAKLPLQSVPYPPEHSERPALKLPSRDWGGGDSPGLLTRETTAGQKGRSSADRRQAHRTTGGIGSE
jgi:hypothetical protein